MQKNQIVRIKYCDYPVLCSECVRFSVSGMKIISGTAHRELAERIAQSVGIQLTDVTVNTFPDELSLQQKPHPSQTGPDR